MPPGRKTPLYGPPGFGNAFNNYTWNMTVWDNRLWIGTMDWSHPAEQGNQWLFKELGQPVPIEIGTFFAFQNFGGDLYFFQDSKTPAVPESTNGLGNYANFGARTLLSSGNLFVGTANPNNLLTGPLGPKGGWELIELEKKPNSVPLTLLTSFTCEPRVQTGAGIVQCTAVISRPSTGTGVTVGVLPVLFDASVIAPATVQIPNGQTTVTFGVQVGDPTKRATLYLIAGVNNGTMVAAVEVAPGTPRLSGLVTGQGRLSSGVMYVDLELTNSGTGAAQRVNLAQVLPRTLAGTGLVTYATGPRLSSPLPVNLGPLAPGAKTTLRLHVNVPQTVTRFSLTETGTLAGNTGTSFRFSLGQSLIPQ
jgi:hypothetical protein